MAQVLKEESREMILDAAKDEFMENGFKESSMRRIAQKSKMTVGNLYRYFKNKEDILAVIVAPAYRAINKMVSDLTDNAVSFEREGFNFDASKEELSVMMDKLSDGMIDAYVKHKMEFNILMMNSKLNDNIVDWFKGLITGLIAKHYDVKEDDKNVNIIAKGYAIAIFHGIREILKISDMDTESLKRITKIYLNSYLSMLDFNIDRYAI
ncbi:MAG: helix-turn-helix transcriptional regulator [Firmicutes bacterium]|nr:helix-turn-helix transcriptional regulator [Bacillota bacterium]